MSSSILRDMKTQTDLVKIHQPYATRFSEAKSMYVSLLIWKVYICIIY